MCYVCNTIYIRRYYVVGTVKVFQCYDSVNGVFGIFFTVIAFIVSIVGFNVAFTPSETTYKVIIDESVSMVEFNERYEILDQDGLIYEIVEKEK